MSAVNTEKSHEVHELYLTTMISRAVRRQYEVKKSYAYSRGVTTAPTFFRKILVWRGDPFPLIVNRSGLPMRRGEMSE